ncbi:MAG TPA: hypothetical protein PKY78_09220 [Candidatus Omnitrophota bacterium]|nr:hypothetical protein [Candidatus Omnitrophota bacterium]HPS21147.1 hypothetical protein [Candidatus Omnitrophota bacterium]
MVSDAIIKFCNLITGLGAVAIFFGIIFGLFKALVWLLSDMGRIIEGRQRQTTEQQLAMLDNLFKKVPPKVDLPEKLEYEFKYYRMGSEETAVFPTVLKFVFSSVYKINLIKAAPHDGPDRFTYGEFKKTELYPYLSDFVRNTDRLGIERQQIDEFFDFIVGKGFTGEKSDLESLFENEMAEYEFNERFKENFDVCKTLPDVIKVFAQCYYKDIRKLARIRSSLKNGTFLERYGIDADSMKKYIEWMLVLTKKIAYLKRIIAEKKMEAVDELIIRWIFEEYKQIPKPSM